MDTIKSFEQLPKSVIFATVAAIGCFIAAILAEPLFWGSHTITIPPPPEAPSPFFVLTIDDSGSMSERTSPGRTRRDDVRDAAREFAAARDFEREKIGIVVFASSSQVFLPLSHDKGEVLRIINTYRLGGGTMFAAALHDSMTLFERDTDIARINQEHRSRIEEFNEIINEVNQLIAAGRIKGEKLERLLPQTVPKIVLFFTDGENDDRQPTLQKALELREKGIQIYAIAALDVGSRQRADASRNYLAQMTGDPSRVYMTDDAGIRDAFQQMEQAIDANILGAGADFLRNVPGMRTLEDGSIVIAVGTSRTGQIVSAIIWSMLLCLGMCICIVVMQNRLMRKPLYIQDQFIVLCIGGVGGGLIAGFCGDTIFQIIPVDFIGRLFGLCVLGAILAVGMSYYIANLDRKWALIGGAIGGALGAIGFAMCTLMIGQTSGRLLGAAIIGACIGAMIGWIEQYYRNVWLTVMYSSRDLVQVNLGSRAITVGSSPSDTIFVDGVGAKAGTFLVVGDKIQYTDARGTQFLTPGTNVKVGNVELVICSKDAKFTPTKFYPMKMSRAKELMDKQ